LRYWRWQRRKTKEAKVVEEVVMDGNGNTFEVP